MEIQFSVKRKIKRLRIVNVEHRRRNAMKSKAKDYFFSSILV